ncbi:protein MAIN-LIKE 1-like [Lathyrus oleraceus]|uniref:protein MAIN-LIKE 1-like n=1 Tax=Pisum sativum TaxID=3888 RepID=UPI0021CEA60D|nr:protein MAIN-LIKE 1-like [Pisum sativum]
MHDATKPDPPPDGEAVEAAKPESFGEYPREFSLLLLYPNHTARNIWDEEDCDSLKIINHGQKITSLPQPNEEWFYTALSLSGMKDLCMTDYITSNHWMLNEFVERWHTETSLFHLPLGEMYITLDDVSCLIHIMIRGNLIDHGRIKKDEALELMVNYMGVDPADAITQMNNVRRGQQYREGEGVE